MEVLVTAASRHGSTAEIAEAIGRHLAEAGFEVHVIPPDDVAGLDGFDAAVIGSAVYAGHWLEPARQMVERLHGRFATLPVWLFSSGPIGDPPKPEEEAVDVAAVVEATGARAHKVLAGNIDKGRLSFPERAIVRALRVPTGDFRDWDEIARWAAEVAAELRTAAR